jgi:NADH-quinone oxidoreductase subunit L
MNNFSYTIWILLLPLLSFLVVGLIDYFRGKNEWSHKAAGLIGTGSLGIVTLLCYFTAYQYFTMDRVNGVFATFVPYNTTWLPLGRLHFDLGILLDPISVMMLIVISTVSFMVHIYSFGYMHGEKGFQRYYAFLSLFSFSMLGLVLATNIFQMYLFWELVGVSSYLLIGFYYSLQAAVHASKKAFIVTRFADMFFLIGILIFGYYTGSFNFSFAGDITYLNGVETFTVCNASRAVAAGGMLLPTALVLMFIGGAGKSAMFPLHIWLPDAMEGPTPVSALIHAATMVVAGVYQIARLFPLWIEYAPDYMSIIVVVGAFTAFYAAAIACAQSDIKRVLAFSTISQIAFMMVALGVSVPGSHGAIIDNHSSLGYMAGMFHLFTHAMFKACLFLGAGCIIHAVHSNEMSEMGGLKKYMPITHASFLISCLAIAGIPFFSGFSSKDEIISACFAYSPLCGWWMTGVAAMTAFYMFRLYYGIFYGTENKALHAEHVPHEAPWTMTFPLIFLSFVTVGVGIVTTLAGFGIIDPSWSFGSFVTASGEAYGIHFDPQVAATSTVIALCAIILAAYIYRGEKQPVADRLYKTFPRLHKWAYHRFYMDEVYQFVTHKILFRCVSRSAQWIDEHIINGFIDFTAWGANEAGESVRSWQSGDVRTYVVWFLSGAVGLTLLLLCI